MSEQPANYLQTQAEQQSLLEVQLPIAIVKKLEAQAKYRGVSPEALATQLICKGLGDWEIL